MALMNFNLFCMIDSSNQTANQQIQALPAAVQRVLQETSCGVTALSVKLLGSASTPRGVAKAVLQVKINQTNDEVKNLLNGTLVGQAAISSTFESRVKAKVFEQVPSPSAIYSFDIPVERAILTGAPGLVIDTLPNCDAQLAVIKTVEGVDADIYDVIQIGTSNPGQVSGVRITSEPLYKEFRNTPTGEVPLGLYQTQIVLDHPTFGDMNQIGKFTIDGNFTISKSGGGVPNVLFNVFNSSVVSEMTLKKDGANAGSVTLNNSVVVRQLAIQGFVIKEAPGRTVRVDNLASGFGFKFIQYSDANTDIYDTLSNSVWDLKMLNTTASPVQPATVVAKLSIIKTIIE